MRLERLALTGPAGTIEAIRDLPDAGRPLRGVAVIAHPHPLYGGTMDNKVVQTMARAFVASGFAAVRFNFRGIGGSAGTWDEGRGEVQDMLAVVAQAAADAPLALAGFSFGAFVTSHVLSQVWGVREVTHVVLAGTAAGRFGVAEVPQPARARTLVVHGESDDVVPLAAVMDWARPQLLPVTVVPGGGHFFHGQLPLLKGLVARHLQATA
ncbi:MAG: alpha/beta hydrolase [Comamonas sp. SCN 65-56]|uniref:alpha/beta hydrolase n=1 Tax=Comamonas sp. SCN 65-56 TaxID=1660095 RepID=UPI00086B0AE0|nr:alpha/beta family hydrolase [Comamonas sp. SCN 65-56]ODS90558.1 MAG: alpha/beta hydrolase [Comamonas sp. SCN 65-56]